MFKSCSSLEEITLDYDAAFDTSKATDWVSGVAASGTFKKNPNLTIATGANGIPSGWTVEDLDPPYLEFKSTNSFTLKTYNNDKIWDGIIEYSTDLLTWTTWSWDQYGTSEISAISDGTNYKLYLRGKNNTNIANAKQVYYSPRFILTGSNIECNGDIRMLLDYKDPENTTMATSCFFRLFNNQSALIKAPKLPATVLSQSCYTEMFEGTSINECPTLPATILVNSCYSSMFENCVNITRTPTLPAKTLARYCYSNMFKGCSSLSEITILATTLNTEYQTLNYWVSGVAASGDFYRDANTTFPSGENGIPTGWTDHPIS